MIRLSELREKLGRPITRLLHEAIWVVHGLITGILHTNDRCCDNPKLYWRGTLENAAIVSCGFVLADDGQLADWKDPEQIAWEFDLAEMPNTAERGPAEEHEANPKL